MSEPESPTIPPEPEEADRTIDVRRLLAETSVEQACATAERYFAQLRSWDHHLAKPFSGPEKRWLSICPEVQPPFAAFTRRLIGNRSAPRYSRRPSMMN